MVHISNIRDKIEPNPRKPIYLKTIRGLGYRFEKSVDYENKRGIFSSLIKNHTLFVLSSVLLSLFLYLFFF